MYENKDSCAIIHIASIELHFMDSVVQIHYNRSEYRQGKFRGLHYATHSSAIFHDLQLLLDVLRGTSSASCACRCLH